MIETPDVYKRFLKKIGGSTDYGDARFILIWGENRSVTQLKIPQPFLAPYFNCWILAEWHPPEDFGAPSDWMPELGRYPSRGGYVPLAVFRTPKQEPVMLDTKDLNLEVLRLWVHTALKHEHDKLSDRMRVFDDNQRAREEAKQKRIADLLQDSMPAFGMAESVSFHGQQNCNPVLKQKMEQIERSMPYAREFFRRMPRRTSIVTV